MKSSFQTMAIAIACSLLFANGSAIGFSPDDPSPTSSQVASDHTHGWKPKVTTVSVFKNGLGFFTREGEAKLNNGWVHAGDLPPAAFGTLAIYSGNPNQLVDLVGTGSGELVVLSAEELGSVPDPKALLEPVVGSSILIKIQNGPREKEIAGKLLSIDGDYAIVDLESETPEIVSQAIPLKSILSFRRLKSPTRIRVIESDGNGAASANLHMAYLRQNILWIPEYTLKLLDDGIAELTLRGTLINEAEDIVNADVNFVVGVPHFVHSDLLSPLAIGHAIRAIGHAIPPNSVPSQVMSQVMNRSALLNNNRHNSFQNNGLQSPSHENGSGDIQGTLPDGGDSAAIQSLLASLPQSESAGSGDYSVYTKKNITVRQGERASITLMTTRIRYDHRYDWTMEGDIRHLLVLENATDLPWTTGPCLTLSNNKPLSEDILRYTPAQGRGELTVTSAINIAKSITEIEIDRQLKAHEPSANQYYDLVKLRGVIKLNSNEKKPVSIRIERNVQGKPTLTNHSGTSKINTEQLRLIERQGSISWQVELAPKETLELTYEYERYVPSN